MANKTVSRKTVSQICSNYCIFTCFKESCPRGKWAKPAFPVKPLPKAGNSTECPLMQFDAKQLTDDEDFEIEDTLKVCSECKYTEITGDGLSIIERSLADKCIDCPCFQARSAIQEGMSEAASS